MKQIIATNKAPGAIGPYSQGTSCDKLVFTSGQLGIDPATGKLAGQSVEEQTMQALKNWELMVAMAAPATPRRSPATRIRSKRILTIQLPIRKYKGRLESPTARRIPAPIL